MMVTSSSLTWFEEWVLYFEIVWGHTCIRWIDAQEKYRIHKRILRQVFSRKLALVRRTMSAWPRYVRHAAFGVGAGIGVTRAVVGDGVPKLVSLHSPWARR